ncbi:MAG: type IV pili twitching motility protein PilT [Epsilonproteobacteria bacterium]|nr:MAG: type IV pili twitching motility protein PilT [Campylobacterota bacterium]
MEKRLVTYLKSLKANGGSDLHLKAGAIVRLRISGSLKILGKERMSADDMEQLAKEILTKDRFDTLVQDKNLDFTYVLDEKSRFRVNYFHQMDGYSAVFRIIPVDIPSLEALKLPEVIKDFTNIHRGLVLVTGVTGSGKSTTLAAILDRINDTKENHIITIEDPIEFVHKDKKCLVNQRSVGQDTHSFSDALRGALREDPDIILVGEMRDLETIDIAIHAANTGHLVFSTLHTTDAKETIDRIVGMFPSAEQNRIRASLASVLEGVISQRLVKTKDGGRAAAIEILKKTPRIEQLILENRDYEILDALFDGKDIYGTQTFDQALLDLYSKGRINLDVIMDNATNPSDMKLKLQGIGKGALKIEKDPSANEEDDIFEFKEDPDES